MYERTIRNWFYLSIYRTDDNPNVFHELLIIRVLDYISFDTIG